jgi:hypothetical protein
MLLLFVQNLGTFNLNLVNVVFHIKQKNCGLKCGYYVGMGHIENKCWEKGIETKSHSATNNYLEVLVDDESTTLEQLSRPWWSKHDIFIQS